ncbi:MAG: hypothetical protein MZV70_40005 [Desulfobacterales bacterium]|nr:hypothetical protein [Desulfobacterales bacterium]
MTGLQEGFRGGDPDAHAQTAGGLHPGPRRKRLPGARRLSCRAASSPRRRNPAARLPTRTRWMECRLRHYMAAARAAQSQEVLASEIAASAREAQHQGVRSVEGGPSSRNAEACGSIQDRDDGQPRFLAEFRPERPDLQEYDRGGSPVLC